MGSLGWQEIIVIFILALIIFGPRKLPDLGKTIGRGLAEFKKASNELKQTWEEEVRLDKEKESVSSIIKDSSAEISDTLKDISANTSEVISSVTSEITQEVGKPTEITSNSAETTDISKDSSIGSKEIQ
jgi:sec-independent protein translocase protein TatA